MNDLQRERMQRNREAAIWRLRARISHNSGKCDGGVKHSSPGSTESCNLRETANFKPSPQIENASVHARNGVGFEDKFCHCHRSTSCISDIHGAPLGSAESLDVDRGVGSICQLCRNNVGFAKPLTNHSNVFQVVDAHLSAGLVCDIESTESEANIKVCNTSSLCGDLLVLRPSLASYETRVEPDAGVKEDARKNSTLPRLPRSLKRPDGDTKCAQSKLTASLGLTKVSQDFDYLLVIDFEATCDSGVTLCPQEIVEFPAVLVNLETRKIEANFHTFVKPVYHPKLTEFCRRFLGIEQEQVDNAVLLGTALKMHDAWLEENNVKSRRFVVTTWSDWDCKTILESECLRKGLQKPPYFNRWINLRVPHRKMFGNVKANLKASLELTGRRFEGREHSGLDDAKNTAYLALELIRRGTRLQVTSWLKGKAPERSKVERPLQKKPKVPPWHQNLGGSFNHDE